MIILNGSVYSSGQLAEREMTVPSRITASMLTQKTASSQLATNSPSPVSCLCYDRPILVPQGSRDTKARLREAASLEKHVLLKKLRDALESLKGRVAGRNKDDVEEAIAMVEALAVQLTQREGELIQEKSEVKKLANFLKQASEDAKKLVDEERAYARAEIESARATVQRVEEALQEHERMSRALGKQVMDMEHELRALRMQLAEKSKCFSAASEGDGSEALGSCLRINPCSDNAPELSECSIQWYRLSSEDVKKALISDEAWESHKFRFQYLDIGMFACLNQWLLLSSMAKVEYGMSYVKMVALSNQTKFYAPEPFDVGRVLQAEIISDGQQFTLTTTCAIDPAAGLGSYVEALVRKHDVEFNVVVTQMNGLDHTSESIHVLHVGKMRMKLRKGKSTIAKEYYSTSMQLCGVRGGGNAAAQALFWQAKKGVSFVLAFESARERNAAIMLARRFAFDCNIMLAGPDDRAPLGS
ncbi:hypothetical protein D5086_002454 [Populus alba]|uniref:Uncharacterized protein n=1 Tax=Populus alba TaxID=43335 RepID=A0ACC4D2E5_POPAL